MGTKTVNIRRITKDDLGSIIDIDRKLTGKERFSSWPQRVTSHLETYYPPLCYVAEADGKIVGFILGGIRGAEYALPIGGWIDIMGIDPAYQRQKIGQKLVEAFIDECRRTGIKTRVFIRETDEPAKQFLTSNDFKRGELIDFKR